MTPRSVLVTAAAIAALAPLARPRALSAQSAVQAASPTPPRLAAPKALTLPTAVERTLPNGLRLVFVAQHELPVVDVSLVIRTGVEADPAGKEGLATLTADLLDEGAGSRDALALADQIGFLAIRLTTGAGFEQSAVTLHTTRATLDSGLALLADVALRPTFPEQEFTRLREQWRTALLQEQDRGPAMADRAFAALLYGDAHPYGRSPRGTTESAQAVTLDDAKAFWQRWYRPNNATLIVVGDLTMAEVDRLVTQRFGAWRQAPLPPRPAYASATTAPRGTTIYLVDKPKAAQSSFRIGLVGVPRRTPDYYPLTVLNTALGGSFTARLNNTLREKKGYTYGASSRFTMRREAGPFVASAEVVSAKTDSALIEFLRELDGIRAPLPADELAKTKRYLQLGYADRFESPSDIANQIAALVPYDLPLRSLGAFTSEIGRVTAAEVQRVATRYLDPTRLTIVIAGDRASIEAGVRATQLAPVALRDARGRALPPPNARGADAAPMLVSTAWLGEHLGDRDVVALHVGSKAQYDSGHVAGARHVALDEISLPTVPGGLSLQMAGEAQLTAWAERNGIGDRTRVVVIPHDGNLQSATRVFFTLSYLGAGDRVSLLDGGFLAWKAEGRTLSTTAPAAAPATRFTPRLRADLIAYIAEVERVTKDGSRALVDARLASFYNGQGGGYPRPGHIPTAVNIPLNTVSANGFLKPAGELRTLFTQAGVTGDKPVITYCHIGQQATVLWFVATMLGLDARMFDGSFQEWSGRTDLPLVPPAGK